MNVRYRVELSQAERCELTAMLSGGKRAARKLKRAQILLAADAGRSDEEIARTVAVSGSTVYRTKRRFVEGNLERALSEEPRPGAERKLTGKEEALLVATACASPPEGRARWTLELLADAMVKLTEHESLSGETVRRRLAENDLKPWRRDMWCIPQVDGEYVARMEDVLDLYAEAPDPKRPVVCFDESPVQLIGEVRQPIPAEPGQLERYDYEYRRNGTVNLFVCPRRAIGLGARSRSPSGGRPKTTPNACANSSMSTIPMPNASALCRTTCRPTRPAPSMRPSRPPKPAAFCAAWSSTTPPSTPAGSTWSRSRSACCAASAWTAESTTQPPCQRNRRMGTTAKRRRRPHQMDVHNRKSPRQNGPRLSRRSKSHNHCDEVPYLHAAKTELHQFHFERAAALVKRGLEIVGGLATRSDLTCLHGNILRELGENEKSIEAFGNAFETAKDNSQRVTAWIGQVEGMRVADRFDQALSVLRQAESVASADRQTDQLAQIHFLRGNIYFPMGNIDGCLEQHELALKFARDAGSVEGEARALGGLGDAHYQRGHMITANKHFRTCVDLSRKNGFGRIAMANLCLIGYTIRYANDLQQALKIAFEAIDTATTVGNRRAELGGRMLALSTLVEMADFGPAQLAMREAENLVERLGVRRFAAQILIYRSIVLRSEGRCDEAIAACTCAIQVARDTGLGFVGPWAVAEFAANIEDPKARSEALGDGERMLAAGAVGHNHFHFTRPPWRRVFKAANGTKSIVMPARLRVSRGRSLCLGAISSLRGVGPYLATV